MNARLDTHRITILDECEMSNVVPLRPEFPPPSDDRTEEDDAYRAHFWKCYVYSVIGIAVMSAILAYWPQ